MDTKQPSKPASIQLDAKFLLRQLKQQYFLVIAKEDIGRTPELTAEADELEVNIRQLQVACGIPAGTPARRD